MKKDANISNKYLYYLLFLGGLFLRIGIGFSNWSGHDNFYPTWGAPFGDMEAHRTWMHITEWRRPF